MRYSGTLQNFPSSKENFIKGFFLQICHEYFEMEPSNQSKCKVLYNSIVDKEYFLKFEYIAFFLRPLFSDYEIKRIKEEDSYYKLSNEIYIISL